PDHLKTDQQLIAGNALVEAGTFLAILLGTILGGRLIILNAGPFWVCVVTLLIALGGLLSSFWIPKAGPDEPELTINSNIFSEIWRIIKYSTKNVKCLSQFWAFPGFG